MGIEAEWRAGQGTETVHDRDIRSNREITQQVESNTGIIFKCK
jgi:hypothetical protein